MAFVTDGLPPNLQYRQNNVDKKRGSPNLTRQANTYYSLRRPPPQANMGAGIV